MQERINLPIDPEDWPGTPEYEELQERRRMRIQAIRMDMLDDDNQRFYLRR